MDGIWKKAWLSSNAGKKCVYKGLSISGVCSLHGGYSCFICRDADILLA